MICAPAPALNKSSVKFGARLTMRRAAVSSVTASLVSSITRIAARAGNEIAMRNTRSAVARCMLCPNCDGHVLPRRSATALMQLSSEQPEQMRDRHQQSDREPKQQYAPHQRDHAADMTGVGNHA